MPLPSQCLGTACATLTIIASLENGTGTVTSSPAGINCVITARVASGVCSKKFIAFTGTAVSIQLISTASTGSYIAADLSGANLGDVRTTSYSLNGNKEYQTRSFPFRLYKYSFSVSGSGVGTGKVTSAVPPIACPPNCGPYLFDYGTRLSLTATPDAGAVFKQWTGACNGQGARCSLTVSEATTTNAVFDLATDGGTGSGGQPSTGSGARSGGGASSTTADKSVGAELIGVRSARSLIGKRILKIELNVDENVSAALSLTRKGKTLASKQTATVKGGDRVLLFVLPDRVGKGSARLRLTLKDAAGNTKVVNRTVSIPSA